MTFAFWSAAPVTTSAASLTSNRPRSVGPVMLSRMPVAPSIDASSSGERDGRARGLGRAVLARRAADAHQRRAGVAHDRAHVGEVEVDDPGHRDQVGDALDALAKDVVGHPERVRRAASSSRRPGAAGRSRSRSACRPGRESSSIPRSACCARRRPSNENGRVTTPTVSASSSRASSATIGAPPVPVPPPSPAVTKIMSAPFSASFSSSRLSGRGRAADVRVGAGAEPARRLRADVDLHVGVAHQERLRVGVHRDELDAGQARVDHPVDGVRAAAADADDLDHGEVVAGAVSHLDVARPQAVVEGGAVELLLPSAEYGRFPALSTRNCRSRPS